MSSCCLICISISILISLSIFQTVETHQQVIITWHNKTYNNINFECWVVPPPLHSSILLFLFNFSIPFPYLLLFLLLLITLLSSSFILSILQYFFLYLLLFLLLHITLLSSSFPLYPSIPFPYLLLFLLLHITLLSSSFILSILQYLFLYLLLLLHITLLSFCSKFFLLHLVLFWFNMYLSLQKNISFKTTSNG